MSDRKTPAQTAWRMAGEELKELEEIATMTKRELDWADEEAKRVFDFLYATYDPQSEFAHALRSAHRRAMEEAAGIVEEMSKGYDLLTPRHLDRRCNGLLDASAAIRAAIKNEEQK